MQYAYAGMAQAYEDGSPVLCITDGVPAGSSGNSHYDVASAMKTVSKWFGYLDKPERTPKNSCAAPSPCCAAADRAR